jgi:hypothetical protein
MAFAALATMQYTVFEALIKARHLCQYGIRRWRASAIAAAVLLSLSTT